MRAYLGLGANLADPVRQLTSAIADLSAHRAITLLAVSRLYGSAPMGPQDQPNYVNAVVAVDTVLSPLSLLSTCQEIEQAHARVRGQRWGARTLDIDLLSYEQLVYVDDRLTLPHPGILHRDFVLLPWQEIAADYHIPGLGCVGALKPTASYGAHPLILSS
jgi:2-amino-4-hydroxy-6-hydroxymethyldihydropteridine diphosphokinase